MPVIIPRDTLEKLVEKSKNWSAQERAAFDGLLNTLALQTRVIYNLEMRLQNFEDYFNSLAKNLDKELNTIGQVLSTEVSTTVNPEDVDKAIKNLSDSIKNNDQLSHILERILRLAATVTPLLLA